MKKAIFIISLSLNVLFILLIIVFVIKKGGINYLSDKADEILSIQNSEEEFSAKYYSRKSIFEVLPEDNEEIIFLGCSLTEYGQWNELFNNPKVKNRGIGGDATKGVLNRLDRILSTQPRKIFLKVGTNDLRQKVPMDTIVANYSKIVATIMQKSPSTQIIVKSVLPVNNRMNNYKISNEDIIKLNSYIRSIAEKNSLIYLDLHSHFAGKDNQLLEDYTFDGIHLNGRGYLLWKSLIEEYVN